MLGNAEQLERSTVPQGAQSSEGGEKKATGSLAHLAPHSNFHHQQLPRLNLAEKRKNLFLRGVQSEGAVRQLGCVCDLCLIDDDGDLDLRGGDHLDVDASLCERIEKLGRDT